MGDGTESGAGRWLAAQIGRDIQENIGLWVHLHKYMNESIVEHTLLWK
jgi:hypothetical protein